MIVNVQNVIDQLSQNLNPPHVTCLKFLHTSEILSQKFCHIVFNIKRKFASSRPTGILAHLKK